MEEDPFNDANPIEFEPPQNNGSFAGSADELVDFIEP